MKRFSLGVNQGLKKLSASFFLLSLIFSFALFLFPQITTAQPVVNVDMSVDGEGQAGIGANATVSNGGTSANGSANALSSPDINVSLGGEADAGIGASATINNGRVNTSGSASAVSPAKSTSGSSLDFLNLRCGKGDCTYVFLAPINQLSGNTINVGGAEGANSYLKNLYKFGIGIASALAVIMIVLGGAQYASTDAIGGKSEGKQRINAAITGLILALLSFTILNTINPTLVSVNFAPAAIDVQTTTPAVTPVTPGTPGATNPDGTPGTTNPNPGSGPADLMSADSRYGNTLPNNGGVITRFGGPQDSDKPIRNGSTGSVSNEVLRDLNPSTDLYVAYPLSGHTVAGLPDYANTSTANRELATKKVKFTLNNGSTVEARIIDRGPREGNNLDVSGAVDSRIHAGGGVQKLELVSGN